MIDLDALRAAGLTNERLKAIFTAKAPDGPQDGAKAKKPKRFKGEAPAQDVAASATGPTEPYQNTDTSDYGIRRMLEKRISGRLREAWESCVSNYKLWLPVDLAWDSPPITETNIPLMLLAQGKITLESCLPQVEQLEASSGQVFIERDANKKPLRVNLPKFFEVSHNLMKQLVTRRVAAISARYNQFPLLKYESRFTSQVGKIRADMMTAVADKMAEDFNYRHKLTQWIREQTLYTTAVVFADRAWTTEQQVLPFARNDGTDRTVTIPEAVTVKEGVNFISTHPSRTFWDANAALADINSDIGPEYIGFWDVTRRRSIMRQKDVYWNTEELDNNQAFFDTFSKDQVYFDLYYKSDAISIPGRRSTRDGNERKASFGKFAQNTEDDSVVLTNYFERIIPKDEGIGTYAHPVWIRFVVAGDETVIFAEIMPSTPALAIPYNAHDGRMVNTSFAHDCLSYQDQVSNLLSQLLQTQKQGQTTIIELDTDGMKDEDIKAFKQGIRGDNYYAANTHVIEFSGQKLGDLGLSPQSRGQRVFKQQFTTVEKTNEIFNSILRLLNLAERSLFFTAQEMGQYVTKETNATEVNAVNSTTLTMHDFHAQGVDEGLSAMKRIIYESKVTMGDERVMASVFDRYPRHIVERAGFTVVDEDGDPATDDDTRQVMSATPARFTLVGGKGALVYNYFFTSREGTNRAVSSQIAQLQLQLVQGLMTNPALVNAVPREKIAEMLNEAFRASGSGLNLNLRFPGNGSQPLSAEQEQALQQQAQQSQQMGQVLTGVIQELQMMKEEQAKNQDATAQLARAIQTIAESVRAQVITTQDVPAGAVAPGAPTRGIQ